MRRAGAIAGRFFEEVKRHVKSGVATLHLEEIAEEFVAKHGVRGAFKGYLGYPANLCTSINEEVVHGIPSGTRMLREGDIVSIDFGVVLDGFYGDAARPSPSGRFRPGPRSFFRRPNGRSRRPSRSPCRETGWGIYRVPSRRRRKARGSPSFGISSGTGSEEPSTRNRRSPISALRGPARNSCRGWSWPSSPWSTRGDSRSRFFRTGGRG